MPSFKYTAKRLSGETVTGTLEAPAQASVLEALRKQGLVVIGVRETTATAHGRSKARLEDLVIFSRQLATLVEAGIPLVTSLDTLHAQIERPGLKTVVGRVRDDVEGGSNFTDALAKHPAVFSSLFVSMVKAGEASGTLAEILDRLATYLEKTAALQRKVKSALVYPAVVSSMAMLITIFLIVKVVPTFKGIFATLGGDLPMPTQVLLGISDLVRQYLLIGIGLAVGGVIGAQRYYQTAAGRAQIDRRLLQLPIIGILLRKVAIAQFSRTLSTLVKSGVPILTSLEIVGKTAGNRVIEEAVTKVRTSIREGENIAGPLAESGVFPPLVVRMVSVGEQTGQLEKMLTKIADFYESEVDAAVSGLTSILEPLIIAVMGVVVGGIVVAIFLPILKITQYLSQ